MPTTPRYAIPYGTPDAAMTKLDTLIMGGWAPNIDAIVASTRTFAYQGGSASGGFVVHGTIVITNNATRYVQRTLAGVVSQDAALDVTKIPMAIVTTLAGSITNFEDIRDLFFTNMFQALALKVTNPMTTSGDTIYGGAGGVPTVLAKSSDGYVYTLAAGVPVWAPAGVGASSFFSKTLLQLHGEGANNGTVITDSSTLANACTASAGAVTDTSDKVFGASSLKFVGSGSQILIPSSGYFALGSMFCIEFRFKTTTTLAAATLLSRDNTGFTNSSWSIIMNATTALSGKIEFWAVDLNGASFNTLISSAAVNDGAWHHIAIVGAGDTYGMFIDGVLVSVYGNSNAIKNNNTNDILVGNGHISGRGFVGHIDELRIVKGDAVFATKFTPSTSAYPDA